jgi:hypothetical protein
VALALAFIDVPLAVVAAASIYFVLVHRVATPGFRLGWMVVLATLRVANPSLRLGVFAV